MNQADRADRFLDHFMLLLAECHSWCNEPRNLWNYRLVTFHPLEWRRYLVWFAVTLDFHA